MDPIYFENFQSGIASSPHTGWGLMRNADIESFEGAVKSRPEPVNIFPDAFTETFTVNTSTDVCTLASAVITESDHAYPVTLTTTDTLPAGLATDTVYFINRASSTTCTLHADAEDAIAGTSAIDITDTGTGTHTMQNVRPGTIRYTTPHVDGTTGKKFIFMAGDNNRVWSTYYDDSDNERVTLMKGNETGTFAPMIVNFSSTVTALSSTSITVKPSGSTTPSVLTSTESQDQSVSSETRSITVPSGTDTVLFAIVLSMANTTASVDSPTSVTWDGNAMNSSGSGTIAIDPERDYSIYYTVNPTAKTADIVATWSGSQDNVAIIAFVTDNTDQSTPLTNNGSEYGDGSLASFAHIDIERSADNELYVMANQSNGNVTHTFPTDQKVLQTDTENNITISLSTATRDSSVGINGMAALNNTRTTDLFVFNAGIIDTVDVTIQDVDGYKIPTGFDSSEWDTKWQGISYGKEHYDHYAIDSEDDFVYFCNGRDVGSIKEATDQEFSSTDDTTYTFNRSAVDLPFGDQSSYLEELGINVLIGGKNTNRIYPWDRSSTSFNLTLRVPERGIHRMKNIGDVVYILAGTKGNIYYTQGTYVRPFLEISDYVTNNSSVETASEVSWGGIDTRDGALIVGVDGQTSGNDGVFLVYPDARYVIDNTPSAGSELPTSLLSFDEYYYIGHSEGLDKVGTTLYSGYETVLQSDLRIVSTKTEKAQFSTIEAIIAKPASTGNIRVKYRQDTSSSFSSAIATFSADGTSTSFRGDIGLIDMEKIQLQVEMDGEIELRYIALYP